MLILSRKKEESLMIGDDIEIKIIEINEGRVRIGIEAPKAIQVFRKEIFLEIQKENEEASKSKGDMGSLKSFVKDMKKEEK